MLQPCSPGLVHRMGELKWSINKYFCWVDWLAGADTTTDVALFLPSTKSTFERTEYCLIEFIGAEFVDQPPESLRGSILNFVNRL